jgi:TatD DNase family protein
MTPTNLTGPLIDAHAHLDELDALETDLDEAKGAGVIAIVGVGMSVRSNQKILDAARGYPGFVFPAIGYHPWEIREEEIESHLRFLRDHVEPCVAVGEVGLDYKAKVKKPLQKKVFEEVVSLAVLHRKPLVLHCRYAYQSVLSMIAEARVKKAVFHWYAGPPGLLSDILDAGYHISATPAVAYSPPHRAAVKDAPLDRILLETDCPVVYQDVPSRPVHMLETLRDVARVKGLPAEEVARQTSANAVSFFDLENYGLVWPPGNDQ